MKKKFLVGLAAGVVMLGMVGMAQASYMSTVGPVDEFYSMGDLGNSGDNTELDWVNSVLVGGGYDDFLFKDENMSDAWTSVTDESGKALPGIYAYDLKDSPSQYFVIKTGTGNKDPQFDHFLFENVGNQQYAVIDLNAFGGVKIKNIGKVSHINGVGGGGSSAVPEPTTMALLFGGLGVLGYNTFRKKFARK